MARPRAFDPDDVLDKAMRLFWRKGFVATSMSDLYEATGLKPGSLYAAFTDKETLFRQAFERYAGHFRATLPTDGQGLAAIEAWLRTQAELAIADETRSGCFIVNTVTERDVHPPETRALAEARLGEIRGFFADQLAVASARGEIANRNLDRDADALTGAVVAMMALGRAGASPEAIRHVEEAAAEALR